MQKADIRRILMSELYQLPDGWEWKKLEDLFIVKDGTHDSPKYVQNLEFSLITSKNLGEKGLDFTKISYISKEDYDKINMRSKVDLGDLLFAMIGSIGNPVIIKNEPNFAIKNVALFKCKNETNLIEFLRYYLLSQFVVMKMKQEANGATQKFVGLTYLRNFPVPQIPPVEQKRIVQKLDALFERIDKAIALLQKNIDAADNFMNSVLNDVFSDLDGRHSKRTLFSFDFGMSAGGTPLRQNKLFWENGTIEWFSSGELNQLFTKPANEKITQIGLENSSAKLFESGTLLIGMYDTAAMKMSILSNDGSCNQAIVGFKPDAKELNIYFAKYQLEYLKPVILEQRQGVRQKNLNLTKIKNIEISYPDLIIQNKVVDFLDDVSAKIEQVKSAQQQKLQSLLNLKSSILDQAFRGKL